MTASKMQPLRAADPAHAVTIKICGITCEADAHAAIRAGADFVGFVFYPASRRHLDEAALGWLREVAGAKKVGVFRDQPLDLVQRVRDAARLDIVQLHGDEPPEACAELGGRGRVIKAIAPSASLDWGKVAAYGEVVRVLFDTPSASGGGTGRTFEWRWLDGRPPGLAFWIAGGLTPENVGAAVRELRPAGVDVASGVEATVGRKDPGKIRNFIAAVRDAELES